MNQRIKTFKTTSLDLAALLVSEGHRCTTRKTGFVNAEFVFESNPAVDKLWPMFLKGQCEVNVTTFLYSRVALKRELAMKSVEWKQAKEGKLILNPGQFYYFIAEDGKAYKNVYANREPHIDRLVKGNAYLSMNEAQAAAMHTKVD